MHEEETETKQNDIKIKEVQETETGRDNMSAYKHKSVSDRLAVRQCFFYSL